MSGQDERIYRGSGVPHDGIQRLPPPPPWRDFGRSGPQLYAPPLADDHFRLERRGATYQPPQQAVPVVNAALLLRRPLLVTGNPGSGKSGLAYHIAYELGLGPVLHWPISRSTTLGDGLYLYDALGRLEDANLARSLPEAESAAAPLSVGRYLRLGPLGTALLPAEQPRVLLIDDLDEGDGDLPNDLLTVFESGEFEIPELVRGGNTYTIITVMTADGGTINVAHGMVRCEQFPLIVITSSGERDFPPRFLRQCLRLTLAPPTGDEVAAIVQAHLGAEAMERADATIKLFLQQNELGTLAVDQLLNALYLTMSQSSVPGPQREEMVAALLRSVEADEPE